MNPTPRRTSARFSALICLAFTLGLGFTSFARDRHVVRADNKPAGEQEFRLYVPAFTGPDALGTNVATVLNLQVWQTLRRAPTPNPDALDFGRGVWPAVNFWNAAAATTVQDGHMIGLNLSGGWTDGTGMTENAIIFDGTKHTDHLPLVSLGCSNSSGFPAAAHKAAVDHTGNRLGTPFSGLAPMSLCVDCSFSDSLFSLRP